MPLSYNELNYMERLLTEWDEELYWSFLEYGSMDESGKDLWRERMEIYIKKLVNKTDLSVLVTDTLDNSDFLGNELYFDLLNNYYIIL